MPKIKDLTGLKFNCFLVLKIDPKYKGEKKCISEWGEIFGLKHDTISSRLERGLSVEEALTKKVVNKITFVNIGGVTMPLSHAEKKLGFGSGTIRWRLKNGYTIEDALSTPTRKSLRK